MSLNFIADTLRSLAIICLAVALIFVTMTIGNMKKRIDDLSQQVQLMQQSAVTISPAPTEGR